jgi:hypothetical protein
MRGRNSLRSTGDEKLVVQEGKNEGDAVVDSIGFKKIETLV